MKDKKRNQGKIKRDFVFLKLYKWRSVFLLTFTTSLVERCVPWVDIICTLIYVTYLKMRGCLTLRGCQGSPNHVVFVTDGYCYVTCSSVCLTVACSRLPVIKSQFAYLLPIWPWQSCLASEMLFPHLKMGEILPASLASLRINESFAIVGFVYGT